MAAIKPAEFKAIDTMRHSTAHLMAAGILDLFPDAKLGVGPVIENGFFYDVLLAKTLSSEDLIKIENRMRHIQKRGEAFVREDLPLAEATAMFRKFKQDFKVELLEDLAKHGTTNLNEAEAGEVDPTNLKTASIYRTGRFIDLCRGPHVKTTHDIGVFKLTAISGAYWRGSDQNPQMTRIYGVAFATQKELDEFLAMRAEAEKRDHRKLGKDLELFTITNEVGLGLPLFYPKGALLRRLVENYLTEEQEKLGYVPIWVPHITRGELYKISGHLDKYDAMYPPMKIDDEDYYLKPMSCPHFMLLYKSLPHSYRELPLRYTATTTVYRYEKSGELSGLNRVRSITQDDCHVFCTPTQIESELSLMLKLVAKTYKDFKFKDFRVRISLRDSKNKQNYLGEDGVWSMAENALRQVVKKTGWKSEEAENEAAFYGPKLDFMLKDAIGREHQLSTIQLDLNLSGRFELEYTGSDGAKHRPVVIHRAVLGSTERFLGILIEHFAGAFPIWLAPVQVQIMSVSQSHLKSAQQLQKKLLESGLRAEVDGSTETVGYKIRKAEKMKVPYMLVIGDKEKSLKNLTVRVRGKKTEIKMSLKKFVEKLKKEIEKKK